MEVETEYRERDGGRRGWGNVCNIRYSTDTKRWSVNGYVIEKI